MEAFVLEGKWAQKEKQARIFLTISGAILTVFSGISLIILGILFACGAFGSSFLRDEFFVHFHENELKLLSVMLIVFCGFFFLSVLATLIFGILALRYRKGIRKAKLLFGIGVFLLICNGISLFLSILDFDFKKFLLQLITLILTVLYFLGGLYKNQLRKELQTRADHTDIEEENAVQ